MISAGVFIVTRSIVTGTCRISKKMLYDQAQLPSRLDAFQITGIDSSNPLHDIPDYVGRDMTSKEGGYFSAEDAG